MIGIDDVDARIVVVERGPAQRGDLGLLLLDLTASITSWRSATRGR
jgi:hypothetical protein